MSKDLLRWDIYEVTTDGEAVNGVKLRGRIRKLGIERGFNVLAENTTDVENGVRFAVLDTEHGEQVADYVHNVISGATVRLVQESVANPVLSKLQVNIIDRYEL